MKKLFCVGSGPSLAVTPMDDLKGQDVMVMNKFGRIKKHHGWELVPKYYFKVDHNTIDQSLCEEVGWAVANGCELFLWDRFRTGYPEGHPQHEQMPQGIGWVPRANWFPRCADSAYQWNNVKATQSWHLPELCTAFGGMSTMIQLGTLLGYDAVILLGCDLGYTPDVNKNHAIPNYTNDTRDKSEMDNGNMLTLHQMAHRCSPIPIYNATVGGYLEVHPRITLEEALDL